MLVYSTIVLCPVVSIDFIDQGLQNYEVMIPLYGDPLKFIVRRHRIFTAFICLHVSSAFNNTHLFSVFLSMNLS